MSNDNYNDLQKFADITIERWINRIYQLNIRETGELIRSFDSHVRYDANGKPELVVFTYLYYGLFPDLGVGTGVTMDMAPSGNRKIKAWFNKIFWKRLQWIAYRTAEQYGIDAAEQIKTIIERQNIN
ncbi:MAG: hypothetical protein IJA42_02605 [Bacteroidales bacterium]|nr:hypothetical protein [Bacteroidales bacterium]